MHDWRYDRAGNHKSNTEPNLLHFPIHGGGGGEDCVCFSQLFVCLPSPEKKTARGWVTQVGILAFFSRGRVYLIVTATKKVDIKAKAFCPIERPEITGICLCMYICQMMEVSGWRMFGWVSYLCMGERRVYGRLVVHPH